MKKYSNYGKQVCDNVEVIEVIEETPEFWHEPLIELLYEITPTKEILDGCDLPLDTPTDTESFYELESEYHYDTLDQIYIMYKVNLKGEYNDEHRRLNIFYNDDLESYILPVYHFGTSWDYISAMENDNLG